MLCRIADLLIEVPEAGGMAPRCGDYRTNETGGADIIIRTDLYKPDRFPYQDEHIMAYMESCVQFCSKLLNFDGLYLHASAIEREGKAYLFSGPSGMGKSTHTRLWQSLYPDARVFNDDKPALRRLSPLEASARIISQTTRRFQREERLDLLLQHVDKLVREIPVYELHCLPDANAARLSYETMRRGAEEIGL